ncbi:MAG: FUSC family protein [Dongiaceae bacterium]
MTLLGLLGEIIRLAIRALGRELRGKPSKERVAFATQAALSVGLSVALAYSLDLADTWWAAISAFAVMQMDIAAALRRGVLRLSGTALGAAIGCILGPAIGDVPWLFVPVLGVIGAVSVYRAIGSDAGYAWILGGITAVMVIFEGHLLPSLSSTAAFAGLRLAEVAVGTFSCMLVSGLCHLGTRHHRAPVGSAPESAAPSAGLIPPSPSVSSPAARALLAWEGGLAISVLAAFAYGLDLAGFAQAMVTVIAVLILPANLLADRTPRPVFERMTHRFIGCLLAGVLGLALLPLTQGHALACMPVLLLGVWVGCHVQTGQEGSSYIGRQFTIAFIMVFVQDHHWSADPVPAMIRLSGILAGILVLGAVMLMIRKLIPAAQGRTASSP